MEGLVCLHIDADGLDGANAGSDGDGERVPEQQLQQDPLGAPGRDLELRDQSTSSGQADVGKF